MVVHLYPKLVPGQQLELAPDSLRKRPWPVGGRSRRHLSDQWRRRRLSGDVGFATAGVGDSFMLLSFSQSLLTVLFYLAFLFVCQWHPNTKHS